MSEVYKEDAFSYPTGVEGENKAVLVFDVDGQPDKHARFEIPGGLDALYTGTTGPNRDIIDITDSTVLAMANQFTTSIGWELSDGETMAELVSGSRSTSKSRKS
jgi:hypothetical protein